MFQIQPKQYNIPVEAVEKLPEIQQLNRFYNAVQGTHSSYQDAIESIMANPIHSGDFKQKKIAALKEESSKGFAQQHITFWGEPDSQGQDGLYFKSKFCLEHKYSKSVESAYSDYHEQAEKILSPHMVENMIRTAATPTELESVYANLPEAVKTGFQYYATGRLESLAKENPRYRVLYNRILQDTQKALSTYDIALYTKALEYTSGVGKVMHNNMLQLVRDFPNNPTLQALFDTVHIDSRILDVSTNPRIMHEFSNIKYGGFRG